MKMKNFLLSAKVCVVSGLCLLAGTAVKAQINLAGVYELNKKVDVSTHQMYMELDFVNQRPDFTQTFKEKTADFKLLPADFMNAKKLKQRFKGTKAPGFARYREKTLFTVVEELKITNPHSKGGVILADWENELGKTGKAVFIPNEDGSIITYGLTALDRALSPDGMRLELVKNLLPAGVKNPWIDGAGSGTGKAAFIEEIKTQCGRDLPKVIERLIQMPDDSDVPEPEVEKPVEPSPAADNEGIKIQLWGDNHPVAFLFSTIASGGDYGKMEINSQLDFWSEEGGVICMRMTATTVYVSSGRTREYEYIYKGRRKGNKIIFTHRMDSYNDGKYEPLESFLPSEAIIKSPTKIVFDGSTYTQKIY